MPEAATSAVRHADPTAFDAAARARLRALTRPGFEPKTLVKSITPFEIAALVLFVVLVAGVFLIYSLLILPDQVRYVQLSNEVAENRTKIEALQQKAGDPAALTSQFQQVRDSLEAFRGSVLKPRREGRLEILDAIDRVTRETGVHLASAVDFTTEDPTAAAEQNKRSSDATKVRSYPSLQMSFSISGSYAQLRSFISRFEGSGQFVVINGISLSSGAKESGGEPRDARAPAGGAGAITLQIAMTAYFQPDAQPAAAQQ